MDTDDNDPHAQSMEDMEHYAEPFWHILLVLLYILAGYGIWKIGKLLLP